MPWPMNGRLFWRTADAAVARVGKKYSRPSQFPLNKHTKDVEGAGPATKTGIEWMEVGIGSNDEVVCQRGLEAKQSSVRSDPTHIPQTRSDERAIQERGRHAYEGHQGPCLEGMRPAC